MHCLESAGVGTLHKHGVTLGPENGRGGGGLRLIAGNMYVRRVHRTHVGVGGRFGKLHLFGDAY